MEITLTSCNKFRGCKRENKNNGPNQTMTIKKNKTLSIPILIHSNYH